MSLKKSSPNTKLLLPKIISKPTLLNTSNPAPLVPDPMLYHHLSSIIQNLGSLSNIKQCDSDKLLKLSDQLASIAIECRRSQSQQANSAKAQKQVRYLKLKIKTLETDLQFRQEQVIRLQNRIKAMSEFYSRECNKPRYNSPQVQGQNYFSRVRHQMRKESQDITKENMEYGLWKKEKSRTSFKSAGKENSIHENSSLVFYRKTEAQSTQTYSIEGLKENNGVFLTRPLDVTDRAQKIVEKMQPVNDKVQKMEKVEKEGKENKEIKEVKEQKIEKVEKPVQPSALKISRSSQTQMSPEGDFTQFKQQFKQQFQKFKQSYQKKMANLKRKNQQLMRLAYIYRTQCHELTEGHVKAQLKSLRHSLSLDVQ